eukprot:scaffold32265_cov72-Phaeocystis_antarctica.AAC.5
MLSGPGARAQVARRFGPAMPAATSPATVTGAGCYAERAGHCAPCWPRLACGCSDASGLGCASWRASPPVPQSQHAWQWQLACQEELQPREEPRPARALLLLKVEVEVGQRVPQQRHKGNSHLLAALEGRCPLQPPHELLEAKVRLHIRRIHVDQRAQQVDHARTKLVAVPVHVAAEEPLESLARLGVARGLLGRPRPAPLHLSLDAACELAALRQKRPL